SRVAAAGGGPPGPNSHRPGPGWSRPAPRRSGSDWPAEATSSCETHSVWHVHLAVTNRGPTGLYSRAIINDIDPFIGTAATGLPRPRGLAASWWFPKPQVGNTHPGATSPLGMVSACAYSGAYPTGYGLYSKNTEGLPEEMFDRL